MTKKEVVTGSQKKGKKTKLKKSACFLLVGKFSKKTLIDVISAADNNYETEGFTVVSIKEPAVKKMKSAKYNFVLCTQEVREKHNEVLERLAKVKKIKIFIENYTFDDFKKSVKEKEKEKGKTEKTTKSKIEEVILYREHQNIALISLRGFISIKGWKAEQEK